MEIREGTQRIENGTKQAIIEFVFTDYIIFVFQGTLSQFYLFTIIVNFICEITATGAFMQFPF